MEVGRRLGQLELDCLVVGRRHAELLDQVGQFGLVGRNGGVEDGVGTFDHEEGALVVADGAARIERTGDCIHKVLGGERRAIRVLQAIAQLEGDLGRVRAVLPLLGGRRDGVEIFVEPGQAFIGQAQYPNLIRDRRVLWVHRVRPSNQVGAQDVASRWLLVRWVGSRGRGSRLRSADRRRFAAGRRQGGGGRGRGGSRRGVGCAWRRLATAGRQDGNQQRQQ